MGRRYSKLEGKTVDVIDTGERPTIYHCTITGFEWSLGCTIQEVGTKKYIICMNGKSSPVMKDIKINHKLHRLSMAYIYDTVKAGQPIRMQRLVDIDMVCGYCAGFNPNAADCAFSQ